MEPLVVGRVHHAHASAAELADQAVAIADRRKDGTDSSGTLVRRDEAPETAIVSAEVPDMRRDLVALPTSSPLGCGSEWRPAPNYPFRSLRGGSGARAVVTHEAGLHVVLSLFAVAPAAPRRERP